MELSFNLISIIIFYAAVVLLLYKYRKKLNFQKIIVFIKSKFGIKTINKLAKFKRFWKWWGYAGIPAGFVGMIAVFYLLSSVVYKMVAKPEVAEKGVQLIFPGTKAASVGPVLFIPFWYFIIALAIVIFVHEGCHGILARVHKLRVKSTGAGLFLFTLPFAFVEPDEKQLKKAELKKQLSVYAAGPFANICVGFILLFVLILAIAPVNSSMSEADGIYVVSVTEGFPAAEAGIEPGSVIVKANSVPINGTDAFVEVMDDVEPGETVALATENKTFQLTTVPNEDEPEKAHIGVQFYTNYNLKDEIKSKYGEQLPQLFFKFTTLLEWIILLNIGIGLINLLPLGPIDGGRMVKAVLERKVKNKNAQKKIFKVISIASLLILLGSIFGSILLSL